MRIVCLSDTHRKEQLVDLPDGDMLIHAGDFDIYTGWDFDKLLFWIDRISKKYKYVVFVAGNHDILFEGKASIEIEQMMPLNTYYLMNNAVTLEGIKIWGSPFSPFFGQWAFMAGLEDLKEIWKTIPEDTNIVVTHSPPFGINDQVRGISQGCPGLRDRIKEIKPKYHICGHIHCSRGIYKDKHTTYINCSVLDDFYELVNEPIVIDYD